jgi:protein kinase D
VPSNNITLQRVVQSVRHTKRVDLSPLKEGWLFHFTSKSSMRKKHYWHLDSKTITLFQSENDHKFYKEIPLSGVLSIDAGSATSPAPHAFQLRTEQLVYYVGDSPTSDTALAWARAIRQSLMPVVKNSTTMPKVVLNDNTDVAASSPRSARGAGLLGSAGDTEDIHKNYQIFPDEVLGSGQFGVVYAGAQRHTSRQVRPWL